MAIYNDVFNVRVCLASNAFDCFCQGLGTIEYNSDDGILKNELNKRTIYYPSGQIKVEENFGTYYTIKYYNEDGTERK